MHDIRNIINTVFVAILVMAFAQSDALAAQGDGSVGSPCAQIAGNAGDLGIGYEGEIEPLGSGVKVMCPIFPEDGVLLNSISLRFFDNSTAGGEDITVKVLYRSLGTPSDTENEIVSYGSADYSESSSWQTDAKSFTTHTVDRAANTYYLTIFFGSATSGSSVAFREALVKHI